MCQTKFGACHGPHQLVALCHFCGSHGQDAAEFLALQPSEDAMVRFLCPVAVPKTVYQNGAARFFCTMKINRIISHIITRPIARLHFTILHVHGNFRILKWRYCIPYKAIFCGDIPILHVHEVLGGGQCQFLVVQPFPQWILSIRRDARWPTRDVFS